MARFVQREPDSIQHDRMLLSYLASKGESLAFRRFFWKGCEPNEDDLARYFKFVRALLLHRKGFTVEQISETVKVGPASVSAWIASKRNSKLSDYLREYIRLGDPGRGQVWLCVNNTPGRAIPLGPFIRVPVKIKSWQDVKGVLVQLKPIRRSNPSISSDYRLGFLLGMMIGDAGKKRQAQWHRHLELVLSKRYVTSERIGDFTSDCANALGIHMKRMPDQTARGTKPYGFYVWESQSSALVDWLFNVCLGLKDNELTTYTSVRMEWALKAPIGFRRGLIQGMAESDGSVSIASQTVEFWIGPHWAFAEKLLLSFGVKSFVSREALCVAKREINHLMRVPPFAPHLKTVRYQKFEKLARAGHVPRGKRLPTRIRQRIFEAYRSGMSVPQVSERILDEFGLVLSFEAVQRWAFRQVPVPKSKTLSRTETELEC